MTDAELLSRAITLSRLSVNRFAAVLVRDPRTVRRWLNGTQALPRAVRVRLEQIVRPGPARAA